jgi:RNA polymerase sigma-70 factor (ECF subfamily)
MVAVRRPARKTTTQPADERLLVEAAQADPSKFDALYELHFHRIYYLMISRVRNRTVAEDLTSEVFHKALRNLRSFEWRGAPFSAWLVRIAMNALKDQFIRDYLEMPPRDDSRRPDVSRAPSLPDERTIEESAWLFNLVEKLPDVQRRVIYERFVEQRKVREIAVILKKSEGAIKQLQFRALETLRAQMEGRDA